MSHINLDKPRYDQKTYIGRAKHFFMMTNPLNLLASSESLDEAKKIVHDFRRSRKLPPGYDEDKLWQTKYLYDSAFHPDTGEKMFLLGRMSAQAPMNTLITGGMITFYKTTPATVFWQWLNQTFNAVVNYTNRSGDAPISTGRLLTSYCAACSGALGTALYLNSKVKNMPPIFASLVPFAAVCGANFINIPMMRSSEIMEGTPVFTPDGKRVGTSKRAARLGIMLVCVSRIFMSIPGMTLTPLITNMAAKRGLFAKRPMAVLPFQLTLVGICVTIATPLCCAFFEQQVPISVSKLEPHIQEEVAKNHPNVTEVYFNKALTPIATSIATKRGLFCNYPMAVIPFQLALVGICVVFATPLGCALFEQQANISVSKLEPDLRANINRQYPNLKEVVFNKGL